VLGNRQVALPCWAVYSPSPWPSSGAGGTLCFTVQGFQGTVLYNTVLSSPVQYCAGLCSNIHLSLTESLAFFWRSRDTACTREPLSRSDAISFTIACTPEPVTSHKSQVRGLGPNFDNYHCHPLYKPDHLDLLFLKSTENQKK